MTWIPFCSEVANGAKGTLDERDDGVRMCDGHGMRRRDLLGRGARAGRHEAKRGGGNETSFVATSAHEGSDRHAGADERLGHRPWIDRALHRGHRGRPLRIDIAAYTSRKLSGRSRS
jgi:hypothetical protein